MTFGCTVNIMGSSCQSFSDSEVRSYLNSGLAPEFVSSGDQFLANFPTLKAGNTLAERP